MGIISSAFGNLKLGVTNALYKDAINAGFYLLNYRKRDGQLKFVSQRGYDNVFVYAAKRTMMQMTYATLNDLYPKYLRQLSNKKAQSAYDLNQGSVKQQIIKQGEIADNDAFDNRGISVRYRGAYANEALVMWIKNKTGEPVTYKVQTYWDKIKRLSNEEAAKSTALMEDTTISVPGDVAFWDFGALVEARSSNNIVLTRVQGRDYSRKELISGGDMGFTVRGRITSNYPDVYPYADVSRFVKLMQHRGVIQVYNLLFAQFNVSQILIRDFSLSQNEGFKNVQPYSFSCVAVEPDDDVEIVEDTINSISLSVGSMGKRGWGKVLLDQVKSSAANQAAQMLESLTSTMI